MNLDRASRYHRLRRRAELAGTLAAGVVLAGLMAAGARLAPVAVVVLLAAVELPFAWYQGFLLEHRYGLSAQSPARWLVDYAKGAAISVAIALIGIAIVYAAIARVGAGWWIAAAVVFTVGLIGVVQLAPVLLLPVFYTVKPLDRPALAERLLVLSRRAGTDVVGVFEWTLSGHTKKANAALAGLGRTRRILVADTLLHGYSDDEIEVILAHELAHHVHHDLWRGVALQTAALVGGFYLADVGLRTLGGPMGLSGPGDTGGLPLLLMAAGAWSLLVLPVANLLSRRHERRADLFALDITGNAPAFVSAMKRLAQQNLAEDDPSPVVQAWFGSHPPIRERLAAARAWQAGSA